MWRLLVEKLEVENIMQLEMGTHAFEVVTSGVHSFNNPQPLI